MHIMAYIHPIEAFSHLFWKGNATFFFENRCRMDPNGLYPMVQALRIGRQLRPRLSFGDTLWSRPGKLVGAVDVV